MAARARHEFCCLIFLSILLISVLFLDTEVVYQLRRRTLKTSNHSSTSLYLRYSNKNPFSHLHMSVRKTQLLRKSFCVTASLSHACVLLSGDVELNPGPIDVMKTTKVSKKDCCLKTIHVNARSLIRHHDDLLSLVSAFQA